MRPPQPKRFVVPPSPRRVPTFRSQPPYDAQEPFPPIGEINEKTIYELCGFWWREYLEFVQDELSRAWALLYTYARATRDPNYYRLCPYNAELEEKLDDARRKLIRNNIAIPL